MRIMVLNGSPRKNGNTAAMVKAFTEGAEKSGNTVIRFDAAYMDVNSCAGCRNCWNTGKQCFLPDDDMQSVYAEMERCDAIVFASPVYWYSYTSHLKRLIDRFEPYTFKPEWRRRMRIRHCALLSCAEAHSEGIFTGMLFAYRGMADYLGWKDHGVVVQQDVREAGEIYRTGAVERAFKLGESFED